MSAAVDVIGQDGPTSSPAGPRAGGPRPRWVFAPAQKSAHLTAYYEACADGRGGGAYLRREGLYSSQITQWRQLRDGDALTGAVAGGAKIPKLTAEQAENARLKTAVGGDHPQTGANRCGIGDHGESSRSHGRVVARERTTTRRSPSADDQLRRTRRRPGPAPGGGPAGRGVPGHRRSPPHTAEPAQLPTWAARAAPGNKLTPAERTEVLQCSTATGSSTSRRCRSTRRFSKRAGICVRCPPCTGCCGKTRRSRTGVGRHGTHRGPSRSCRPPAPGQVFSWDITKLAGPVKGQYFDAYVMIDIYSRMIVGVHVHHIESALLAVEMMKEIFGPAQQPDGRARRPRHLDDQQAGLDPPRRPADHPVPFPSKGLQATTRIAKRGSNPEYVPIFPERFHSLGNARTFMSDFVDYYNHHHRHRTEPPPADIHYGLAEITQTRRIDTLTAARA